MLQQLATDDDDDYDVKVACWELQWYHDARDVFRNNGTDVPSRAESPSSLPSAGPAHVDRAD